MQIKDIRTTRKQLIVGYRTEWLESVSKTNTRSDASVDQQMIGYNHGEGLTRNPLSPFPTTHVSDGSSASNTRGSTRAESEGNTRGRHQSLVPIHQTFDEVANITYKSFDEHRVEWGQKIRTLSTGHAFATFANDPKLYSVLVDHEPIEPTTSIERAKQELIEKNFEQEFFISADSADQEANDVRRSLLKLPPIVLDTGQNARLDSVSDSDKSASDDENPFCV